MCSAAIDWYFVTDQIHQQKCTPIVSNRVINDTLFGGESAISAWADESRYPLADGANLTRVAQFLAVSQQDPVRAKSNYLHFLKRRLLEVSAEMDGADPAYLQQVRRQMRGLTFSQLALEHLKQPAFTEDPDHPIAVLAGLDIPIYLTTSHHHFIEAALRSVDKNPRTEVYCWREGLEANVPPQFRTDLDYMPSIEEPLVYHLHGIDDYPDSLVLTEDDHLEFLVNFIRDLPETDVVPSSVRNAISSSLLILIGFELHAWDLRVILQGLIRGKSWRPRSFAIQLLDDGNDQVHDNEQFQDYLQKYFGLIEFDVYWGSPRQFMLELWQEWEAG